MSDQTIDQARSALLEPTGLRDHDLDELLGAMMRPGVDYADLYFQRSRSESWMIEDGMVRSGSFDLEQGMGARALSGEKTGFAYSDELHLPALEAASSAAGAIARSGGVMTATRGQQAQAPARYAAVDPLNSLPTPEKLSLLERADKAARAADSRVIQVIANVVGVHEEILVAAGAPSVPAPLVAQIGRAIGAEAALPAVDPGARDLVGDAVVAFTRAPAPGVHDHGPASGGAGIDHPRTPSCRARTGVGTGPAGAG